MISVSYPFYATLGVVRRIGLFKLAQLATIVRKRLLPGQLPREPVELVVDELPVRNDGDAASLSLGLAGVVVRGIRLSRPVGNASGKVRLL